MDTDENETTQERHLSQQLQGRNKVFLFGQSFFVLTQSHCSSPITTKSCAGAVRPLFCTSFIRSFPHFSYKEVPNLQKINLFTLVLFNFFFENTVMHCLLAPNTLEIQTRLRLTLSQSQHFKRLLNAITHKHSIIYNPFILNQKSALALNIGYDLLNLSLGLFQTCSHSFTNFEGCLLIKLLLQ